MAAKKKKKFIFLREVAVDTGSRNTDTDVLQ